MIEDDAQLETDDIQSVWVQDQNVQNSTNLKDAILETFQEEPDIIHGIQEQPDPLNEFTANDELIYKSFPTLFPTATGLHGNLKILIKRQRVSFTNKN